MKLNEEESLAQMHNEWLKHQNAWQQVRHGLLGPWGRRAQWGLVLCVKALVVLALATASVAYLLPVYTKSAQYKEISRASLENALHLQPGDARFKLVSKNVRDWTIPSLLLKGNDRTFFKEMSLKGVRGKASVIAGLLGSWRPYSLTIDSLDLLTPDDDDGSGKERYQSLFDAYWVKNLSIKSLNLRWAQNKHSGWLEGASCEAVYQNGRWLLHLKGGVLHSMMFLNCRLIDARIVLAPGEKIQIESCLLQVMPRGQEKQSISVDLQGEIAWKNGTPPRFDARMQSRNIVLQNFISAHLGQIVRGTFAAEGTLRGPFHVPEDWVAHYRLRNQGDVEIVNVPLLQKLDAMLLHRSYRALVCPEAAFDATYVYRTGAWTARQIAVRSDESVGVEIRGELSSRKLTDDEWKELCKRLPEAVDLKPHPDDHANMFFTGHADSMGKGAHKAGLLTRCTPLFEGKIAISFPVASLGSVGELMPETMETRLEGNRLVVELPVCSIASEISRQEADALQLRLIQSRTESDEEEK